MFKIVSSCVTLLLLFSISFSSEDDNDDEFKKKFVGPNISLDKITSFHPSEPFLNNGIVPLDIINSFRSLEYYEIPNNPDSFFAVGENFIFVATSLENVQGKLTPIGYITDPKNIYEPYCVLKAHNLNSFIKCCYKVFDLYDKYNEYFMKTRLSLFVYNILQRDCPWTFLPAKIFYNMFCVVFFYIGYFPVHWAQMLPFYILRFPFEFFSFQFGKITWNDPCLLIFVGWVCLFNARSLAMFKCSQKLGSPFFYINGFRTSPLQIKPQEIKWAVANFMQQEENNRILTLLEESENVSQFDKIFMNFNLLFFQGTLFMLVLFYDAFFFSLPFMLIRGETNE